MASEIPNLTYRYVNLDLDKSDRIFLQCGKEILKQHTSKSLEQQKAAVTDTAAIPLSSSRLCTYSLGVCSIAAFCHCLTSKAFLLRLGDRRTKGSPLLPAPTIAGDYFHKAQVNVLPTFSFLIFFFLQVKRVKVCWNF